MNLPLVLRLAAISSLAALCISCSSNTRAIDALRTDVEWLADDAREGRAPGSVGLAISADFIEARFRQVGLQPLPSLSGYRHPVTWSDGTAGRKRVKAEGHNLVGMMPGRGPHASEFIVIGAHYDHIGRGQLGRVRGPTGPINNGADDNAAGVAALLELARRLHGARLDRSLAFVAFTFEEVGLIGSRAFVDDDVLPADSIVAMVNLDMIGRLTNDRLYVGGTGTSEAFDAILAAADSRSDLTLHDIGRGGIGLSDHASFAKNGVPTIFLFTGLHADYHTPDDDAHRIHYAGLVRVISVAAHLIRALATMPRQAYIDAHDGTPQRLNIRAGDLPITTP